MVEGPKRAGKPEKWHPLITRPAQKDDALNAQIARGEKRLDRLTKAERQAMRSKPRNIRRGKNLEFARQTTALTVDDLLTERRKRKGSFF